MTRDISHAAGLPRDVADGIMVRAIARCAWIASVAILLLAFPVFDRQLGAGLGLHAVLVPAGALVAMIMAVGFLAVRPSTRTIIWFLVVGTISAAIYQVTLLTVDPDLQSEALYQLNRPALALVLVGTASASALSAVGWGLVGFLAGAGVTAAVAVTFGLPPLLGAGPGLTLINYSAAFVGIALLQRSGKAWMPDLARLREETRQLEVTRSGDRRSAALIHDTILNDLALITTTAPTLDGRTRDRLRRDIHRVSEPHHGLLPAADESPATSATARSATRRFSTALVDLASDFQWRGLSVNLIVDPGATLALSEDASDAALGAVAASLENVLRHSGVDSAEVIVGADSGTVSLMVVDAGAGFDSRTVPSDRLGLEMSVVGRVESVGGAVKVWSAPGSGTSVVMSIPQQPSPAQSAQPSLPQTTYPQQTENAGEHDA